MAGGGIGEAMLLGAATGGITSLLKGKDPIKGVVLGAGFGAAGGALMGGGAGGGGATASGGGAGGASGAMPQAFSNEALGLQNVLGATPQAAAAAGPGINLTQIPNQISNTATQVAASSAPPPASGISSIMDSFKNMSTAQKIGTGVAGSLALEALLQRPQELPGEEEPNWEKWKSFQPTFYAAQGGAVPQDTSGRGIDNLYVSNKGPLDAPNSMQVPQQTSYNAPPQGYLNDSVQMMASGGMSNLGGYSDGGQLLKGPGDGVSDNIPASIGGTQPARLADGEFVVPARIVSELGNGSTDAGARQLYAMMRRVEQAREDTTGKGNIARDTQAAMHLPA